MSQPAGTGDCIRYPVLFLSSICSMPFFMYRFEDDGLARCASSVARDALGDHRQVVE